MTIGLRDFFGFLTLLGVAIVVVTAVVGAFVIHWALGMFGLGMALAGIGAVMLDVGEDLGWF